MVKKLLHTRMRVNDLERTVKFYQDALEPKVARRSVSPRDAQIVFLAAPNSDEESGSRSSPCISADFIGGTRYS